MDKVITARENIYDFLFKKQISQDVYVDLVRLISKLERASYNAGLLYAALSMENTLHSIKKEETKS